MAKIETVKKVATYTLELSQAELNTIVGALQNGHFTNVENAKTVGLNEVLTLSQEADLYTQLRDTAKGGQE
ncbi:hypothetical protein [Priestia megaterium]|uniref:hypothetical protein n=1 Tax=Priestia megaterium TaxID=1404 RepID=UPI0023DC120A|nr:hypothetical protein [Priestia megaterium]MDF2010213.1 hypothetical protein [Priestia megaterium]